MASLSAPYSESWHRTPPRSEGDCTLPVTYISRDVRGVKRFMMITHPSKFYTSLSTCTSVRLHSSTTDAKLLLAGNDRVQTCGENSATPASWSVNEDPKRICTSKHALSVQVLTTGHWHIRSNHSSTVTPPSSLAHCKWCVRNPSLQRTRRPDPSDHSTTLRA